MSPGLNKTVSSFASWCAVRSPHLSLLWLPACGASNNGCKRPNNSTVGADPARCINNEGLDPYRWLHVYGRDPPNIKEGWLAFVAELGVPIDTASPPPLHHTRRQEQTNADTQAECEPEDEGQDNCEPNEDEPEDH
jgi:hypothetical protein